MRVIMTTPQPTLTELDYSIKLILKELSVLSTQMNITMNSVSSISNTIKRRRLYMKRLLLYKAEQLLPTKIDAYIDTLIRRFGQNFPSNVSPPPMEHDTTPTWVIADAVITEENITDRQGYQMIFRYVYDIEPDIFFTSNE